jgi:hypothetical protein
VQRRFAFETMGNATLVVSADGAPVLATDPWLVGTAYFGSWSLDHPLTPAQIGDVARAPYLWISHGHPDHLHPESLALLPRTRRVLVPDHYHPEMREYLAGLGFPVTVLAFKRWTPLAGDVRVMCLDNENQDAILVVEAGDAVIVDANDSPMYGEEPFFRRLVARYRDSYLLALCSIDADMMNLVDARGQRVTPPPDNAKRATVIERADLCTWLGVRRFCCFSSQHLYVRADSTWANPYRITWEDMRQHWNSPTCELIEPFVTVDLADGSVRRNHPSQQSDLSSISTGTGEDDWRERMSPGDWAAVERFVGRFETLPRHLDFLVFEVGGERRTLVLGDPRRVEAGRARGIRFSVPRRSLMASVDSGYFDDLLIGNFMRTELIGGTALYPDVSPLIAKFGGAAKVYSARQLRACRAHYARRSPAAYARHAAGRWWEHRGKPRARGALRRLGLLERAKRLSRRLRGLADYMGGSGRPPSPPIAR